MMCKGPQEQSTHLHTFLPGEIGFEVMPGSAFVNYGAKLSWKKSELKAETLETRTSLRDEGRD